MKLSEKIALNAEIASRLMCAKPDISIKDLVELAKEIIDESEKAYSKEHAHSSPSQKEYWDKWKPQVIE